MNRLAAMTILGILTAGITLEAYAQGQSPSGTDPLVSEYDVYGPATIESEPYKTSGTISSIYAYYEFEGEVDLVVSANGGSTYKKIINGTILKDGFIPGNELCYKANIPEGAKIKKVVLGYKDTSGVSTIYKNPDLANYKNYQILKISGAEKELFNYPVRVDLEPITQNLEPDIYFTAADGQTPLYYYIEEGSRLPAGQAGLSVLGSSPSTQNLTPNTYKAICYVKIPQIPKQGTMIYVYYGDENRKPKTDNRAPSNYNDPNKVFLFFDDFSGTMVDEEKWEVTAGLKKEYNLKDSKLQLKDCMVISRNFKIKQGILEFKAKAESNCSIQAIVRGRNTPRSLFPLEQIVYSSNYPGAEHAIAINDIAKLNIGKAITPLTNYIYKITFNQTGIIFERYSENYQKQAQIQFLDMGNFDEGYIGLKANAAPFNAGSVYYDWVRVRPYLDVEPQVTSLLEQGLSLKGTVPNSKLP